MNPDDILAHDQERKAATRAWLLVHGHGWADLARPGVRRECDEYVAQVLAEWQKKREKRCP